MQYIHNIAWMDRVLKFAAVCIQWDVPSVNAGIRCMINVPCHTYPHCPQCWWRQEEEKKTATADGGVWDMVSSYIAVNITWDAVGHFEEYYLSTKYGLNIWKKKYMQNVVVMMKWYMNVISVN